MTLHCLFCLVDYNVVSIFRTVVTSVRMSVKCRISTDTGCAGRRWPTAVYHENTVLKQLGVIWVDDRFNLNITYQNHRRCTCTVCGPVGSFMVRLFWLYDTIGIDNIVSTVDTYLWTLRPVIIYLYPSQPFWLDRLFQYQYTVYVLPLLSSQGYVSLSFKLCVCLDEHLFLFA